MKALLSLEVKFAALRDRLYVERMEETAAEEEMILNGESRVQIWGIDGGWMADL